ncbi:Protein PNS1 [Cucumispora dikerogammari]|nr:Protein PNS1 [Cucumispora dikerogammari]
MHTSTQSKYKEQLDIKLSSNDNKFFVSSQRKLHDMWALVLYIIFFSIFIIVIISASSRENVSKLVKVSIDNFNTEEIQIIRSGGFSSSDVPTKISSEFFFGDVFKLIIIPIILFGNLLVLMYFFTGLFLHVAFILPIVGSIIGAGLSLMQSSVKGFVMLSITALLSMFIYFLFFRRLKFVSKPFKMSIHVMLACFGLFTGIAVTFTVIALCTCYAHNIIMIRTFDNTELTIARVFIMFFSFWTIFLISTVSQTAMSAVTAQYVIHDLSGNMLLKSSLRIVFYSLGSACFAALLLAIVATVRQLVEDKLNRNSDEEEGNGAAIVILFIIMFLLSFIEEFLEFLTSWAMTVVALKGCKLSRAMKSVIFDIRTGFLTTIATGQLSALLILLVIIYLATTLIFGTRFFFLKEILSQSNLPVQDKISYIFKTNSNEISSIQSGKKHLPILNMIPLSYALISLVFLGCFTTLLQKIMEMLYLIYNEEPSILERKDESVYGSMKEEEAYNRSGF